jgi:hypothetical protein
MSESVECPKELQVASADTQEVNESNGSSGPEEDGPAGEDVWHGISRVDVGDTAQVSSTVHKPPTGAEITAIRTAQDLFMSSSFKLQVCLIANNHVSCRLTVAFPID